MLEKFIRDYSEKAFHFAYRLCGDVEQSKELVQEAFFRAMRNWDRFDQGQPLELWFYAILRNIYLDGQKSFEARNRVSLDQPIGEERTSTLADALPDRDEALLESLERRESRRGVLEAIDSLKPEHRAILTMADIQTMDYGEIARVMDCPPGTVRSRVNRARQALKKRLRWVLRREANEYAV
jgi:RNA polymerase sigma-70 factor, ECF subfamily